MQLDKNFLRKIACCVGKLPKGTCGLFEQSGGGVVIGTITVDLNQTDEVGATILHELTHALNPDWTEKQVLQFEKKEWARMSMLNKLRLYSWFFGKVYVKGVGDDT